MTDLRAAIEALKERDLRPVVVTEERLVTAMRAVRASTGLPNIRITDAAAIMARLRETTDV
jgi:hypothetical protein